MSQYKLRYEFHDNTWKSACERIKLCNRELRRWVNIPPKLQTLWLVLSTNPVKNSHRIRLMPRYDDYGPYVIEVGETAHQVIVFADFGEFLPVDVAVWAWVEYDA